jgi:ankyrin repeat protein
LTSDVERLNLELFEAASLCRPKAAKSVIEAGADVNWKDSIVGLTPLHAAVARGCVEVVDILINAKADVNVADGLGRTPLH